MAVKIDKIQYVFSFVIQIVFSFVIMIWIEKADVNCPWSNSTDNLCCHLRKYLELMCFYVHAIPVEIFHRAAEFF